MPSPSTKLQAVRQSSPLPTTGVAAPSGVAGKMEKKRYTHLGVTELRCLAQSLADLTLSGLTSRASMRQFILLTRLCDSFAEFEYAIFTWSFQVSLLALRANFIYFYP